MSPQAKMGLSKLLKGVDQAMKVTKNKQMLKELRADRAAILEIVQNGVVDPDYPTEERTEQPSR